MKYSLYNVLYEEDQISSKFWVDPKESANEDEQKEYTLVHTTQDLSKIEGKPVVMPNGKLAPGWMAGTKKTAKNKADASKAFEGDKKKLDADPKVTRYTIVILT